MSLFDVILLIIIGGFAMFGFWFGMVHTLGSLVGTVLGAYVASRYYESMAAWLVNVTGWESNYAKVLMFIIAFVVINRLIGFGFWILDKVTSFVTNLPFLNSLNRFLGVLIGLFEGVITLGLIFYFIERVPLSDQFMGWMSDSSLVPFLVGSASILIPLLPEALKMLRSTVDYVEDVVVTNL